MITYNIEEIINSFQEALLNEHFFRENDDNWRQKNYYWLIYLPVELVLPEAKAYSALLAHCVIIILRSIITILLYRDVVS
jgi:hypothetical protein